MLNFKNAWLGLIGKLPMLFEVQKVVEKEVPVEVVKEAIGKASGVMLYQFNRRTGRKVPSEWKRKAYREWNDSMRGFPFAYERENPHKGWETATEDEYETVACHSCEQAHSMADGATVVAIPAIRVGAQYFLISEAKPIKVLPKPKLPK